MNNANKNQYRFITSQNFVHVDLKKIVLKHKNTEFLRPISKTQKKSFEKILGFAHKINAPLILDSGCGTGHSTIKLAKLFPFHGIIGVDKSQSRIDKAKQSNNNNYIIIRANFFDMWPLIMKEKLPITHHFIFYPNPWPKIGHLKRRIHGHPLFPNMLKMANYFEVRTNWKIFADEMLMASKLLGYKPSFSKEVYPQPISLFEKKYLKANSPLFSIKNYRNSSRGVH